jgi:hypothetical protein
MLQIFVILASDNPNVLTCGAFGSVPTPKAPTARPIPAWGAAPGTPWPHPRGLKARPIEPSIPHIPLVPLDPILLQQRPKLILERMLPMMHLLRVDIPNQRLQIRRPDRKRTIPALPREPRQRRRLRLQPSRRRRFHLLHQLRHTHRPRQSNREMHVIRDAPNPIAFAPRIPHQRRQIQIKLRTHGLIQNRRAIFRAEDHMNQNKREGLRHRADYRSGLQPSSLILNNSWGCAPCWYSVAPSALSARTPYDLEGLHHE